MLKIIETFNNLPSTFDAEPSEHYQPGQIGALKIKNNQVCVGICDGINPIGIIDDIHSNVIRHVVWNELVIIPNCPIDSDLKLSEDVQAKLKNTNIIGETISFSGASPTINAKTGIVTFHKGTFCNYHTEAGVGIKITISYAYNIKCASSTSSTNKVSVWTENMIAETNMYDVTAIYPKNANLYVKNGLLSTNKTSYECKCIGIVLYPPTNDYPFIKFLFDPKGNIKVGNI